EHEILGIVEDLVPLLERLDVDRPHVLEAAALQLRDQVPADEAAAARKGDERGLVQFVGHVSPLDADFSGSFYAGYPPAHRHRKLEHTLADEPRNCACLAEALGGEALGGGGGERADRLRRD